MTQQLKERETAERVEVAEPAVEATDESLESAVEPTPEVPAEAEGRQAWDAQGDVD